MKKHSVLICAVFLLLAPGSLSCARVFPPAEAELGATPAPLVQPPSATHARPSGDGECLACHGTHEKFVAALLRDHPVPIPPGFAGSAREACELCHAMEPGHAASDSNHPAVGAGGDCLACHAGATGGLPQMPLDHEMRANDTCTMCHTLKAQEATPTSTPAPAAASTPALSTMPTPSPTVGVDEPGPVPHALAGMEACLTCHISQIPASHSTYDVETCTLCHTLSTQEAIPTPTPTPVVASSPTPTPAAASTPTPAPVAASTPAPVAEPTPTPVAEPTPTPPTSPTPSPTAGIDEPGPVPHTLVGMGACLTCHISQIPASHSTYDVETCTLCHAQSQK